MTAPRFTLSEDGAVVISHTVATLNARAMFARLRSLAARAGMPPDDRGELQEELDALVDQTADVLWAFAGMVDEETYEHTEELLKDARDDLEKAEAKTEELEQKLAEIASAASDTPEELQSKYTAALARQVAHNEEIARMKAKADAATSTVEAYRKASADDNRARREAENRMGVWGKDVTAAESADKFRADYDRALQEHADFRARVRKVLSEAKERASRSKVVRVALAEVGSLLL